jgi:hypothetical protein
VKLQARATAEQGAEKQASGRQPRQHQLKAQGSKLKGKDPIRSPFSFQLRAFNLKM